MAKTRGERRTTGQRLRRSRAAPKTHSVPSVPWPSWPGADGNEADGNEADGNEADQEYFDLYYSAPVGYVRLDPYGVIEQLNRAACLLFNAAPGELLGRPLLVFVVKRDRPAFLEHMRRCRNTDEIVETELRVSNHAGVEAPVRLYTRTTGRGMRI